MSGASTLEKLLVVRIRAGQADAWNELIAHYEGRLLAFIQARTKNLAAAEDLVQETFIGFLTSLPNYDARRSLESYLFSIAAHKLTDYLRRQGRRPAIPMPSNHSQSGSTWEPPGDARGASSLVRSGERRRLEEEALVRALADLVEHWTTRGDWVKLQCVELLFVRGWANKDAAARLGISEQAVANYKFEFLSKLRSTIRRLNLPEDVFPELYQS